MMVNFPEVDTYGHVAGTEATVIQPLISNIDREIGRLVAAYTRAGMINQTYWIVTSDHGMVPALHTIESTTVKRVILNAGGQSLYIGHGDYCPIWLKNLDAVPRVAAALSNAAIPNVAAVFAKSPQGKYRLVSPISRLADPAVVRTFSSLLDTLNQGESPDIILAYDENTITMTPNFLKVGRKGDHEGATWGAQHIPFYLAGPGIKHGLVSQFPARLVDIAPTVEALLGTGLPAGQDGVPLADAMIHPSAAASALQAKRAAHLAAMVQALQTEAALRPNL
jgi:arylsulfatase A-like enzyme